MRVFLSLLLLLWATTNSYADEAVPALASSGVGVAQSAAAGWAEDAYLVYVENDEGLAAGGKSSRWGYLFYSPARNAARAYSVQNGNVVTQQNLGFKFKAPPVSAEWVDSTVALLAANDKGGRKFCEEHGGAAESVFLMRAAIHESEPNMTTWTIVYKAAGVPSLFVVVDAKNGKVKRKWRG